MGHIKRKRPRRGSLQFWHRKRASRIYPRIRNQAETKDVQLMGFAGYKAGMTQVFYVDSRPTSPTKGDELCVATTIIECPPMKIMGLRLYKPSITGSAAFCDVLSDAFDIDLSKKITLPKKKTEQQKIKDAESKLEQATEIRLLVSTQPKFAGFGKKKPEIFEMAIGGSDIKTKFEYAKTVLGKEIKASDVLTSGQYYDAHAVTTGKGYQGVIKRFGVRRKVHKSEKGVRRVGTLGAFTGAKTWRVPHPGQMGFHTRTEYNKQVLLISNPKENEINPSGGLINYGVVKSDYILVVGSIPGPKKRIIRFTPAIRMKAKYQTQAPELQSISLRSQQG
ncbi:50S ribosomal protein L3 [Candidatus Woesearchaeota archaeon]|jgi:large subunit ribosomal protein L3|nr:50S ribosomal protein L3 [Candidatus Woesearchaeota archaeon]MBT4114747.1 50S ribosomal protein L3 [Candidatus Woesearchaeota archaeon]MBT4248120.1 50S ribosomal protein L3 [Candidatus Woesearchaeota archaeon]